MLPHFSSISLKVHLAVAGMALTLALSGCGGSGAGSGSTDASTSANATATSSADTSAGTSVDTSVLRYRRWSRTDSSGTTTGSTGTTTGTTTATGSTGTTTATATGSTGTTTATGSTGTTTGTTTGSTTTGSTTGTTTGSTGGSSGVGAIPFTLKNQDTAAHAPPSGTAAQYDYNLFTPSASNFPAVGNYYSDPVFGAAVRRLTNIGARTNNEDIYAHHWANADGTLAFSRSSQLDIIKVADGTKPYVAQPLGNPGFELYWDALDPDKYYYYNGASLMRRSLSAQTNATMKTFPATLQSLGGSLNFQSRDGRYFIVQYSGTAHIWDSLTDTIYAGAVTPLSSSGWVSITPDGKYMVTAGGWQHYSYAIDHTAKRIASSPIMFWDRCGDHGVLISASDGKSYFITHSCYNTPGVYRVDISKNQSGRTDAQQLADNQLLVATAWANNDGHMSAVSRGPLADWVFVDTENMDDGFNSSTAGWTPYKNEIIAVNVTTLQVRRLAQHRSRGMNIQGNGYYNQPRVSCSWDGSVVLWTSNYNVSSPTGYADMYVIQGPIQ
jgi:hypothetical protein